MKNIKHFLLWAAGVSESLFKKYTYETFYFESMGALVCLIAILSVFSGGYLIHSIVPHPAITIVLALLWGAIIFHLNRLIALAPSEDNVWVSVVKFAVRAIVSIFIGLLIAIPVELTLSASSIEDKLNMGAKLGAESVRNKTETLIIERQSVIDKEDSIWQNLHKQYINLKPNQYKKESSIKDDMNKNVGHKNAIIVGYNQRISNLTKDLDRFKEQIKPLDKFDIFQRYEAYCELKYKDKNNSRAVIGWLLTFLFILLDMLPVVLKQLVTMNSYEHDITTKRFKSFSKMMRKKDYYKQKSDRNDTLNDVGKVSFSKNGSKNHEKVL